MFAIKRFVIVFGGCMWGITVQAAWDVTPRVSVSSEYDDNVRLSRVLDDGGLENKVVLAARIKRADERSSVTATVGGNFSTYSGVDLDDTDSQFVNFDANRNISERTRFGLGGLYLRDQLLRADSGLDLVDETTSVPDVTLDPDVATDVDAGAIFQQVRRTRYHVNPYFKSRLTEKTSLQLDYRLSDFSYDSAGQLVGLTDTRTHQAGARIARTVSRRNDITFAVKASRFETDRGREDTDYYQADVGLNHRLTENSRLEWQVGASQAEADDRDRTTGFTARVMGFHRGERSRLLMLVERALYPTSFGELVDTNRVYLDYTYFLTEHLNLIVNAEGIFVDSSENFAGVDNMDGRDVYEGGLDLEWEMSRNWRSRIGYLHRRADRDQFGNTSSNSVRLTISYEPPYKL